MDKTGSDCWDFMIVHLDKQVSGGHTFTGSAIFTGSSAGQTLN